MFLLRYELQKCPFRRGPPTMAPSLSSLTNLGHTCMVASPADSRGSSKGLEMGM